MSKAKVFEFINLTQENMSVKEHALNFILFAKYAQSIVVDSTTRMSKFVSSVSKMVVKESHTAMLINEMVLSCLMTHTHQIK